MARVEHVHLMFFKTGSGAFQSSSCVRMMMSVTEMRIQLFWQDCRNLEALIKPRYLEENGGLGVLCDFEIGSA